VVDSAYTFFNKASKKENVKTERIKGLSELIETVEKWKKVVEVKKSLILVDETHFPLRRFI